MRGTISAKEVGGVTAYGRNIVPLDGLLSRKRGEGNVQKKPPKPGQSLHVHSGRTDPSYPYSSNITIRLYENPLFTS